MSNNSLDKFELYYEELEKKKVAKAKPVVKSTKTSSKPKTTFKVRFSQVRTEVAKKLNSLKLESKLPEKKKKKLTKAEKKANLEQKKRGIS